MMGIRTTSGDREGEVVEQRGDGWSCRCRSNSLAIPRRVQQIPSMFSALKRNGRPLYEYAREGIEIERARTITVHRLELLDFNGMSVY